MAIPDVFLAKRIDKELKRAYKAENVGKEQLANMLLLLALGDGKMVKQAAAISRVTGLGGQQDWDRKLGTGE
ncbi:unnamed protein product [marine sediment metagenome]|uniref:Uncharacterized protein n=1 Tax=marine sediment metagenome TaxID=412755 RepID=X1NZ16_9ZZZZ